MPINLFSGPSFDTYSQARTDLYKDSPSKFHYDIDVNKAAGDFIQNKTNELLGNNIFSNVVGTAGKIVGAPLATLASPFHEGVQVVKENRMEPDSGILGWGKAFLDEDPFSTAMNRGIGVASSIPGFDKTKMGILINAYKKHIENKKQNFQNIEAKAKADAAAAAAAKADAAEQAQAQASQRQADQARISRAYREETGGQAGSYAPGGGSGAHAADASGSTYSDPFDPGGGEARGGFIDGTNRRRNYLDGGLIDFFRYGGFIG